jgi:hypothetical protein
MIFGCEGLRGLCFVFVALTTEFCEVEGPRGCEARRVAVVDDDVVDSAGFFSDFAVLSDTFRLVVARGAILTMDSGEWTVSIKMREGRGDQVI